MDVETTIFEKGNPFARRNRLCYVGCLSVGGNSELANVLTGDESVLVESQRAIEGASLLIGFNFKFDLHWLRRTGVSFANKRVWDCQFAHFLLQAQRGPYPSLEGVCEHYGIPGKLKHIEENYWSKGIDTPDIPEEEMLTYLLQDLVATQEVYHRQVKEFEGNPKLYNLFKLHMDDLLVLEDMEYNGLWFNTEACLKEKDKAATRLAEINQQLSGRYPNTPINWDSGDHVSHYLFGGTIKVASKEANGIYISGLKKGQIRYKNVVVEHNLTRLLDPVEGSELAKADKEKGTGPWSTASDVLKQLKQSMEVKLLLERAELSKLLDYLQGWPELIALKDWNPNEVHGQFNQVVARTGRLSSSNPNQQNMPDEMLKLVETRYG